MFHRRYSAAPTPAAGSPVQAIPAAPAPGPVAFVHEVRVSNPAPAMAMPRERLRQRQEEAVLQQQLLETEQELDGILEEEKQLVRRREELRVLNARGKQFHDRRMRVEERIDEALADFERESHQCAREERALEKALATCRRYVLELEQMAPAHIPPLRSESALRRQLDFLADFEHRLEVELSGVAEPEPSPGERLRRTVEGDFGQHLRRGFFFFLPYFGLGGLVLWIFFLLTGGR